MSRRNKKGFRIICLISSISLFSFFSCAKTNDEDTNESQAEIWTASGTEKILRDWDYSDRYDNDTLEIKAFRNENESAQIIITPNADTEFSVQLSDLKNAQGDVLPQESFSVYQQLYINVEVVKEKICATGAGYYPDALLPYEKAVACGENTIGADRNQGLWITVKPSKTQAAGLYTGSFAIETCSKEYEVPVSVTVYDYTLGDETHIKTKFELNETDIGLMELNTSYEMCQKYYEFLLEHRISASTLPYGRQWLANLDLYMENVLKYTLDPRCACIPIPWTGTTDLLEITADGYLAIDDARGQESNTKEQYNTVSWVQLEKGLLRFAEDSFKHGVNLFQKAELYLTIIDEYDVAGLKGLNKAVYNLRRTEDMMKAVALLFDSMQWTPNGVVCSKELSFDKQNENAGYGYVLADKDEPIIYECSLSESEYEQLISQMKEDLLAIRNTTTATDVTEFYYDNTNAGFCPTIDYYSSEGNRDHATSYAEKSGGEMWTYTAVNPINPYPTYHIEDVLISSRLITWMMYDYDIVGNLYWATTLSRYTAGFNQVFDYYNEPLRYSGANGDGFLMYPGRKYGIDGPIGSIRLQSILDSNEDYDLMYELEAFYKERGVSATQFDSILDFVVSGLYSGTACNYDGDYLARFAKSRDLLADILSFTANTGAIIENVNVQAGVAKLTLSVPQSVSISLNGKAITGVTSDKIYADDEPCLHYALEIPLVENVNVAQITATSADKAYTVTLNLGGKVTASGADTLINYISVISNTEHDNDVSLDTVDQVSVVKMQLTYAELMQAEIDIADLKIDETCDKVFFNIYNYGEEIEVAVKGKSKNSKAYVTVGTFQLANGWTEVVVDLADFKLAQNGELLALRLAFANGDGKTENIIVGLKDILVRGNGQ